jgi:caa(3)-type oxidase subunit IV
MTSHAPAADGHAPDAHAEHIHPPSYYIKIWGILLVLLAISIAGPMLEVQIITLMTAFGIAVVKAWLVCSKFMHLNIEKKFVIYFLVVALGLMLVFYFGAAPDVMKHEGTNWKNVAAQHEVARGLESAKTDPHHAHGKPEAKGAEHH